MEEQKWIVKYANNLLDYGPIILTVLFASFAALLTSQSGITVEQTLQWILIILVLISTTQLLERFRLLRNVDRKLDAIIEQGNTQVSASQFFSPRMPDLQERLRMAKSIDHNGITLAGTSNNRLGAFSTCISAGGKIRLLMVDPTDKALEVAAERFYKHQDHVRLRREADYALDNFLSMYRDPSAISHFKIGFIKSVPPYSIWILDANTPQAEIWVGLYPFRDDPEPTMKLLPYKDDEYYRFFQKQFELMWDASTIWEPSTSPPP